VDGQFDPSVTWDDLAWVRQHWPGKLVLKGILDPEDAKEAVEVGADAIVVSNHGGRQLDEVRSTASSLRCIPKHLGSTLGVPRYTGAAAGTSSTSTRGA
jgi:L-lactate dehydrogenase (cytochrome)